MKSSTSVRFRLGSLCEFIAFTTIDLGHSEQESPKFKTNDMIRVAKFVNIGEVDITRIVLKLNWEGAILWIEQNHARIRPHLSARGKF